MFFSCLNASINDLYYREKKLRERVDEMEGESSRLAAMVAKQEKMVQAIMESQGIEVAEEVVPAVKAVPEKRTLVVRKRVVPSGPQGAPAGN